MFRETIHLTLLSLPGLLLVKRNEVIRTPSNPNLGFVNQHPESTFEKDLRRITHQHATAKLRVAFGGHFLAPDDIEPIKALGSIDM
jgi:hypothetical protein